MDGKIDVIHEMMDRAMLNAPKQSVCWDRVSGVNLIFIIMLYSGGGRG